MIEMDGSNSALSLRAERTSVLELKGLQALSRMMIIVVLEHNYTIWRNI